MIRSIKNRLSYLWSLKFVKDVFTLQVGSFFGTGLAFTTSVIYTRVLGVEVYGTYVLIFAFAGLIALFSNWGSGYATLTLLSEAYAKKDKAEIKNVLSYFFKINFIVIASIGLLGLIFAPQISSFIYKHPQIGIFARLIILATIIRIFFSLVVIIFQVKRKIKHLTVIENINKLLLNFVPVIFVLLGFSLWGIVWGHFLTTIGFMFFSLIVYHHYSVKDSLLPSIVEIFKNFSQIKIYNYFKFGFSVSLDKNISSLFSILPLIVLGALATPEQVANLKISISYLALPMIFLAPIGRLLQVQLPKAKTVSARDLRSNFYKSFFYSGFAFIPLVAVFLLLAPFLIKIFYGHEFNLSILLVYPLSLSIIFSGFMVGVGSIYRTINKMKLSIIINILNLIFGFLLFIFALQFISALKSTVLVLIFWSFFSFITHFFVIRHNLGTKE